MVVDVGKGKRDFRKRLTNSDTAIRLRNKVSGSIDNFLLRALLGLQQSSTHIISTASL